MAPDHRFAGCILALGLLLGLAAPAQAVVILTQADASANTVPTAELGYNISNTVNMTPTAYGFTIDTGYTRIDAGGTGPFYLLGFDLTGYSGLSLGVIGLDAGDDQIVGQTFTATGFNSPAAVDVSAFYNKPLYALILNTPNGNLPAAFANVQLSLDPNGDTPPPAGVPEPATMALLGTLLVTAGFRRRRVMR